MQGQILSGRYEIVKQIGKGGFGVTFLALDMQRPGNPKCVVKQFKPMVANPYTLQVGKRMFDMEAQTLEKLGHHDQIPRLLAHFEENQEFYLVQEFIEGHDLDQEVPLGQQQTEAFVINILYDTLEVLAFVHQSNAIHRDIKPSNIRRRLSDNKIVLIDFGAVKQITTQVVNSQGQTNFTVAVGTLGYMPSEQANNNPRFSSDVYAVGMIAIQALTGINPIALPKDQDTGEIIWRDRAQVSSQLADIIDNMVRYDFRQRYETASEALQALTKLSYIRRTKRQNSNTAGHSTNTSTQPPSQLKKFLIGVPIVAVLATIVILYYNSQNRVRPENFLNYANSSYGINIKYPQSWERQDINNPITGEVVAFISPKQNNTEKLTISVEDFSGTLEEFSNSSIKDIKSHLSSAQIVNTNTTILAHQPAKQLVFTGKDGNSSLKNLQVFTLRNYKAYVITYTADIENYDDFMQTAEKMVKSFEFQ